MKVSIHPFRNEEESLSFGNFTIENRTDRVTIYGTMDITRDKKGLANGRQLRDVLVRIVEALEAEADLPDQVAPPKPPKTIKNPFA